MLNSDIRTITANWGETEENQFYEFITDLENRRLLINCTDEYTLEHPAIFIYNTDTILYTRLSGTKGLKLISKEECFKTLGTW